jgi:hypothetical protein
MKRFLVTFACIYSFFVLNAQSSWVFPGNNTTYFMGKVGIGTAPNIPQAMLHNESGSQQPAAILATADRFTNLIGMNRLAINSYNVISSLNSPAFKLFHEFTYNGASNNGFISFCRGFGSGDGYLELGANDVTSLTIKSSGIAVNGNIQAAENSFLALGADGITSLTVNSSGITVIGKIQASEVEVSDAKIKGLLKATDVEIKNISADYVFDKRYKLDSLQEVEKYINEHQHLSGIAPATETMKGMNISKFNSILLLKVEELTLYLIDQNKRIEKLEKENGILKKQSIQY